MMCQNGTAFRNPTELCDVETFFKIRKLFK